MTVRNFGTVGRWVLAATVVESALALGTVHTSALVVLVVLSAIAAALLFEPAPMRRPAKILTGLAVVWTLFTVVQLIPLPASWVAAIAPHNADVWSRALRPLGEVGPRFIPISVDPVATRIQVARGLAYVLILLAALAVARSRSGVRFLTFVLVASGTIVALAALLHPAFDQTKVFGLYAPHKVIALRHIAPLLNANHLSAYVTITLCCALVVALDRDLGRVRILPAAIAALLIATQFWIASRGGVVAMVVGIAAIAALRLLRARSVAFAPLLLGLMVIGGVAMGVFGQWDEAWNELADTDVSKLHLFAQTVPMIRAYPLFGAGRGAFESAFPEFRTIIGYDVFTNPENVLLQWTTEWGIPAALAGIVGLAIALRPSVAMVRGKFAMGAWAALAAVGLHNMVDFSSETPGVVVALIVCAAIVVGGTPSSRGDHASPRVPLKAAIFGAGAVGLAFALLALGKDVETDRGTVLAARTDAEPKFDAEIRAAMLRHPAEPYLPYAGALHARIAGKSVVPWVERTLERAPVYGPAHLLLARELAGRSRAQARLEDRIGIEQMLIRETTGGVVHEAMKTGLVRSYEEAIELVPTGRERAPVLEILSSGLAERYPATAWRLDTQRLSIEPVSAYAARRRAEAVLADLRGGPSAPWCSVDRGSCLEKALQSAEKFEIADAQSCEAHAVEAQVRIQGGDPRSAFVEMRKFTRSIPQKGSCLAQLAQVAASANLPDEASAVVDELAHATCTTTDECVSNLLSAAALDNGLKNPRRALAYYQKAADLAPERDDINAAMAQLAMSIGMYSEAVTAYQHLVAHHPENSSYADGLKKANEGLIRFRLDRPDAINSEQP